MSAAGKTMDESLAESWKEIQAKYAVEDEPETPAPVEEPPDEDDPQGEPPQGEKPRDETGKFVKPAKEAKPAKEKGGADKPSGSQPEGQGPESTARPDSAPPSRTPDKAPSTWRPAMRAEWAKLPEGVRQEILKREQDFSNGQQQLMPDAQFGKSLRQTIEPYRMLIEAEGGTPEKAVESLMRTAAIFRVGTQQQKYDAWAQIGRQFLGIELNQNAQPQARQEFQDPRVDQLLAFTRQQESERAQRAQNELGSQVTSWMEQVDEKGGPKYPYLSDVITDMAALLPQIKEAKPHLTTAQVLEEGYQRAIWANPEVRTLLQREAASERAARDRADNQTRVRDAKRAASVNVPRRASIPAPAKPGRLEDTIAEEARRLGLFS